MTNVRTMIGMESKGSRESNGHRGGQCHLAERLLLQTCIRSLMRRVTGRLFLAVVTNNVPSPHGTAHCLHTTHALYALHALHCTTHTLISWFRRFLEVSVLLASVLCCFSVGVYLTSWLGPVQTQEPLVGPRNGVMNGTLAVTTTCRPLLLKVCPSPVVHPNHPLTMIPPTPRTPLLPSGSTSHDAAAALVLASARLWAAPTARAANALSRDGRAQIACAGKNARIGQGTLMRVRPPQ